MPLFVRDDVSFFSKPTDIYVYVPSTNEMK